MNGTCGTECDVLDTAESIGATLQQMVTGGREM